MRQEQLPSQNIQEDIDTKTFIIHWKMRNWKTQCAIFMALEWEWRIYSNFKIYRDWTNIVNYLEYFEDIAKTRFSKKRGVLIIDEAWLNVNSKDWQNKESRSMEAVLFLIGKKNLTLIWIAQRYKSINVNAREMADKIVKMRKIQRPYNYPTFEAVTQKDKWTRLEFINSFFVDSIGLMREMNITYDQLEASVLKKGARADDDDDLDDKEAFNIFLFNNK